MNLTIKCGFLAHPLKLTPPCQEVKYTGYLWNTEGIPTLLIPPYKVDKSLALIDYALDHRTQISRLCLAVVKGVLESQVDATPSRSGHTHLRSMEETLHPTCWTEDYLAYYSYCSLSDKDVSDLQWWQRILMVNRGHSSRADNASILVPTFGDGSGTGTGGTVQYTMDEPMHMWKAVWADRTRPNTSNWKEVETCRLTLENAKASGRREVRGCTFFYFTDNMFTYYGLASGASRIPSLHSVVEACKELEAELNCQLEPIHVPGTTIIIQTTDGLSRGVWASALHDRPNQKVILSDIFAPLPFSPAVGDWARQEAGISENVPWFHRRWDGQWQFQSVQNCLTVWTPPPEVAAQLLHFLLHCYVEAPLTTACLLVIPRILQRRWSQMSRLVREIGIYQRSCVPFICHSVLTIPVVLIYIPYHIRVLPDPYRLDETPIPSQQRLHEATTTYLRRMFDDLDS